ncbi:MAG TPA: cytochrome c family protein [Rhizomicrobium sp.]|jgi:cytochrome c|nr:cytochrome c family protein [Rhizomicrobium sp.]
MRRNRSLAAALAAAVTMGLAAHAHAASDPAKGKTLFQRCAICHRDTKDGGNGLGPNLFGVVGRKAGTVAGFNYSAAMKNSGIVWSADKLNAYIEHPAAVVPGNRMAFAGISDAGQRADVVAYLATLK